MEFKVGDRVSWNGLEGTVIALDSYIEGYPIYAKFNDMLRTHVFTSDGKYYSDMAEPCLKLIERPKKKVKKTVERWVNIYPEGPGNAHPSREWADKQGENDRIACVKLTGEYEVEVDE